MKLVATLLITFAVSAFASPARQYGNKRYRNKNSKKVAPKATAMDIDSKDDLMSFLESMWEQHGKKHSDKYEADFGKISDDVASILNNKNYSEKQQEKRIKNILINYAVKNFEMDEVAAVDFADENIAHVKGLVNAVNVEKWQGEIEKYGGSTLTELANQGVDAIENEDAQKFVKDIVSTLDKTLGDELADQTINNLLGKFWDMGVDALGEVDGLESLKSL